MNCSDLKTIDEYLNDSLSPSDETAFEQHLETCSGCRLTIADRAGSDDEWTAISTALLTDDFDGETTTAAPSWPLTLLGPTDDPRMLGRIGPLEVSGCVGVGGMGVVFKARDPALDRYVAVKVLSPQLAASEVARVRFHREAKAAAAVVHDNVIAVHQVSSYQGLPYLVMPYLPGPSLDQRLKRSGPMPVVEALRVARQVAAGLAAAHDQGLIHRDIKPANILLSGDTERAILTDFGLARAADDATLTRSGALAGTPQFMAPEQARGEPTDTRSDIFSLGALLFAMLTGHPAVRNLSGAETVRQVGSQPPLKITDVMHSVPSWLNDLLDSLHAFRPEARLKTANDVELVLRKAMQKGSKSPLKRRAVLIDSSMANDQTRRRIVAGTTIGIVLAVAIALSVGLLQRDRRVSATVANAGDVALVTQDEVSQKQPPVNVADQQKPTNQRQNDVGPPLPPPRILTAKETAQLLSEPELQNIDIGLDSLRTDIESLENR